jgi:plasmid maintenance system antidote protein VapI
MRKRKPPQTPLDALRQMVAASGNHSAVAKELGIPRQHMADLLNGKRGISESLANSLGFKRLIVFEPNHR